jgi:hypothetical protein
MKVRFVVMFAIANDPSYRREVDIPEPIFNGMELEINAGNGTAIGFIIGEDIAERRESCDFTLEITKVYTPEISHQVIQIALRCLEGDDNWVKQ